MTKTEIINDTVNYYSKDPKKRRSLLEKSYGGNTCVYNGPNKTHCAVGRFLLSKYKKKGSKLVNNDSDIEALYFVITDVDLYEENHNNIDDILTPKAKGHDMSFWTNLQSLHDRDDYWNSKGLTNKGEIYKELLLKMYSE